MIPTIRCRSRRLTISISRPGSCIVSVSDTMIPRASAARVTPEAIAAKYGSAMSCTTSPSEVVRPRAIAWAVASGM
jgi:hypothetical protein